MASEPQLSDQQLAFMRVLWDRGEATVAQMQGALADDGTTLAPTTVSTVLSRLERRGLAEHRRVGRQYIYRARVAEHEVRRSMLTRLTDFFFGGDPQALVSHLTAQHGLDEHDRAEITRLFAERQRADEKTRESNDDGEG